METNSMLTSLFECVVKSSWQAAVLVCLVLVVQGILGGKLSPRWRYSLWFLVLIRLLVPVTPQSALSIYNLAPERTAYARGAGLLSQDVESFGDDRRPPAGAR